MGPEASRHLSAVIREVRNSDEVNLTHYNGIHDEVFSRQS